jgi:hypothetical protein
MDHIAKSYCVVFMDYISIISDTQEEHKRHVRAVMDTLQKNNFKLKGEKCTFGRRETEFVGYRVARTGIRMQKCKIESIASWPLVASPKRREYSLD